MKPPPMQPRPERLSSISRMPTGSGYGVYSVLTGHGNTGYAGYFENTDTSNSLNYAIKNKFGSANGQSAAIGTFSEHVSILRLFRLLFRHSRMALPQASTAGVNSRANEANGGSAWGVIGTANGNASGTLYGGSFTANPVFFLATAAYREPPEIRELSIRGPQLPPMVSTATTSFSMSRAGTSTGYGVYGTNTSGSAGNVTYSVYGTGNMAITASMGQS